MRPLRPRRSLPNANRPTSCSPQPPSTNAPNSSNAMHGHPFPAAPHSPTRKPSRSPRVSLTFGHLTVSTNVSVVLPPGPPRENTFAQMLSQPPDQPFPDTSLSNVKSPELPRLHNLRRSLTAKRVWLTPATPSTPTRSPTMARDLKRRKRGESAGGREKRKGKKVGVGDGRPIPQGVVMDSVNEHKLQGSEKSGSEMEATDDNTPDDNTPSLVAAHKHQINNSQPAPAYHQTVNRRKSRATAKPRVSFAHALTATASQSPYASGQTRASQHQHKQNMNEKKLKSPTVLGPYDPIPASAPGISWIMAEVYVPPPKNVKLSRQ
ncbi:hypothetical protein BDZ91DRAFT_764193 [Kalaharituber pfeilii]|nr:hypothetical protein BDZ91DRAFT_764193 [Kalaharituber pfeilii]